MLRRGSEGKKPLKEKVLLLYDAVFKVSYSLKTVCLLFCTCFGFAWFEYSKNDFSCVFFLVDTDLRS